MDRAVLEIQNLKCHGCANTITNQLMKLEGVDNVEVNTEKNEVSFSISDAAKRVLATEKLNQLGYPVIGEINHFTKKAKSLVSCAVGRLKA